MYEVSKKYSEGIKDTIPVKYAFNEEQFKKMMQEWNFNEVDKDKIHSIGGGGYIKKSDLKEYLINKRAFEDQETKTPFLEDDFIYFQNIMQEQGIDVTEKDFDKYFEYYDYATYLEKNELGVNLKETDEMEVNL